MKQSIKASGHDRASISAITAIERDKYL